MSEAPRGAVILGASAGIGAGTALALARRGCDVVAVGRSVDKLAHVADEANGMPGRVQPLVGDLADADGLLATLDEAEGMLDAVDLLVHSVATPRTHGSTADLDPRMVYEASAAMVASAVVATGWAQRVMRDLPGGRVLLLSSGAGSRPSAYRSVYSFAKAALEQFVRCALFEPDGQTGKPAIAVVYPGFVDTGRQGDMRELADAAADDATRAVFADIVAKTAGKTITADVSGETLAELAARPPAALHGLLFKLRDRQWESESLKG